MHEALAGLPAFLLSAVALYVSWRKDKTEEKHAERADSAEATATAFGGFGQLVDDMRAELERLNKDRDAAAKREKALIEQVTRLRVEVHYLRRVIESHDIPLPRDYEAVLAEDRMFPRESN